MKEIYSSYVKTFSLCFCGFLLGRLLIFPGLIDPTAPSHDDLYRYFLVSQTSWDTSEWLAPRPLMLLFLHAVGSFINTPETLWLLLSLTSIFFIAALVEFLKKFVGKNFSAIAITLYSAILFSLPSSWEIYQLDYGGMLSGLLCLAGLSLFLSKYRNAEMTGASLFVPLLLYWAAIETKPTFAALILMLALLFCFYRRDSVSCLAVLGVVTISLCVVLKDKYIGSPFLGSDGSGVYELKLSLVANVSALLTYLSASVPFRIVPGLLMIYTLSLFDKRTKILTLVAPLLALSAIAPMILIPNRVLTLYSWYAAVFFLLPLLMLGAHYDKLSPLWMRRLAVIGIIAVLAGQFCSANALKPLSSYYVSISEYNKNVVNSLAWLRLLAPNLNTGSVLVSGLQGPFHPFRQNLFVLDRSNLVEYTLLLRNSERPWDNSAKHLGSFVSLENLRFEQFDKFIIYGSNGKIRHILSKEELMMIPAKWREAVVFCSAKIGFAEISTSDLDQVMACFDHSDESLAAVKLGKTSDIAEKLGPFGLYHFSNSLIKTGDLVLARKYLEEALALADNPHIRNALKSIDAKGR